MNNERNQQEGKVKDRKNVHTLRVSSSFFFKGLKYKKKVGGGENWGDLQILKHKFNDESPITPQ